MIRRLAIVTLLLAAGASIGWAMAILALGVENDDQPPDPEPVPLFV